MIQCFRVSSTKKNPSRSLRIKVWWTFKPLLFSFSVCTSHSLSQFLSSGVLLRIATSLQYVQLVLKDGKSSSWTNFAFKCRSPRTKASRVDKTHPHVAECQSVSVVVYQLWCTDLCGLICFSCTTNFKIVLLLVACDVKPCWQPSQKRSTQRLFTQIVVTIEWVYHKRHTHLTTNINSTSEWNLNVKFPRRAGFHEGNKQKFRGQTLPTDALVTQKLSTDQSPALVSFCTF